MVTLVLVILAISVVTIRLPGVCVMLDTRHDDMPLILMSLRVLVTPVT